MSIVALKGIYILLTFLTVVSLVIFLVNASSGDGSITMWRKLCNNKWLVFLLAVFLFLLVITISVGVRAGMFG